MGKKMVESMKRLKKKMKRPEFLRTSAFVYSAAAGAGLMVGANPELESAPAHAAESAPLPPAKSRNPT